MSCENWFLWRDKARTPSENMAIDEALLESASFYSMPILRFYSWDRPAISIGYIQNFSAGEKDGYTVVRRPTGGGVVYHDKDITYTIVIPNAHWIQNLNRLESYQVIHKVIIAALKNMGISSDFVYSYDTCKDRMKMQCFSSPTKYDIVEKDNRQKKLAGAAQRRTKTGILHQGSITLIDMTKYSKNSIINILMEQFKKDFNISFVSLQEKDIPITKALKLAKNKYNTNKWNKMR